MFSISKTIETIQTSPTNYSTIDCPTINTLFSPSPTYSIMSDSGQHTKAMNSNPERTNAGHDPPYTVDDYVGTTDNYLDMRQFKDVCECPTGDRIYRNGRMLWRRGVWMECCGHWLTNVL